MKFKLGVICPLGILAFSILVFCAFGVDTKAVSDEDASAVVLEMDAVEAVSTDLLSQEDSLTVAESLSEAQADSQTIDEAFYASSSVPTQEYSDSGYVLSDDDRMRIECIVMCEAGGEGEKGQMMVAQCILDGLLRYDYTIDEYIKTYKVMSTSYSNVTDQVRNSVSRVFDNGERVIEAKADLWYNPAITASSWHEEQEYVITVGSHRFFWMIDNNA